MLAASKARLVALDLPNASSVVLGHDGCRAQSTLAAEPFTGSGRSKKEAELEAAQAALQWLNGSCTLVDPTGGTIPGTEELTGTGDLQGKMQTYAFQGSKSEISLTATIGRLFMDDWKASFILLTTEHSNDPS